MPKSSQYQNYPKWLYFDGRGDLSYSKSEYKRIGLLSESAYKLIGRWDSKASLNEEKIKILRDFANKNHAKQKKVRLWGTPNSIEAYKTLNELGFDYIGTDDLELLISVLKN